MSCGVNDADGWSRAPRRRWGLASLLLALAFPAAGQSHPANIPSLNSRPGAAYTVYLDFGGFSFTGDWGGGTSAPGVTPAYNDEGGDFTAGELANIRKIWARAAEKYSAFNVNVTTVDPAVAAGQAASDFTRQAYYDRTADLMHTVIGGNGAWSGGGGVSYVGVTRNTYSTSPNGGASAGYHTNWVFSDLASTNLQFVAEAAAHENGHGFGLNHQGDHFGSTTNEYSTNNNAVGNGSYAPIMGDSYSAQRGTWRVGATDGSPQNDVQVLASNPGLGTLVEDGVGHSLAKATPLPTASGGTVDYNAAKGVIVPISGGSAQPIGTGNYRSDFFSFTSYGGPITLTANDGGELLSPGFADPGATLRSTLTILNVSGNVVGTGTLAASTLSETFNGTLPNGTYYAEISSFGGYTSTYDPTATYYDLGSYFLTGSGFAPVAVPEPVALGAFAMAVPLLLTRRRRAADAR